jgi:hypothetical protein
MTLAANYLVAASQIVQHGTGRNYTSNTLGLLTVPVPDAYTQHTGQFLYWSCSGTSDRPVNTPGAAPWTRPVLDNTVGGFIFPVANSSPLLWVNTSGTKV